MDGSESSECIETDYVMLSHSMSLKEAFELNVKCVGSCAKITRYLQNRNLFILLRADNCVREGKDCNSVGGRELCSLVEDNIFYNHEASVFLSLSLCYWDASMVYTCFLLPPCHPRPPPSPEVTLPPPCGLQIF